ncbi:MAG: phytoene/squalene synthase family protein [Pseudomonadota bacterium]
MGGEFHAQLRDLNRDFYLADLFLPERQRMELSFLQTFFFELAEISNKVSEPMPGEIRLQWWQEVISGARDGEAAANPLAQALLDLNERHTLPKQAFMNLIDVRRFDLYSDPMPDQNTFDGHAGDSWGVLFQLSCQIVGGDASQNAGEASGHAAVAVAIATTLDRLQLQRRKQQLHLPKSLLDDAGLTPGQLWAGEKSAAMGGALSGFAARGLEHVELARAGLKPLDRRFHLVFLPLSLCEQRLKRQKRDGAALLDRPTSYPQWRRQITLWRAARRIDRHAA